MYIESSSVCSVMMCSVYEMRVVWYSVCIDSSMVEVDSVCDVWRSMWVSMYDVCIYMYMWCDSTVYTCKGMEYIVRECIRVLYIQYILLYVYMMYGYVYILYV